LLSSTEKPNFFSFFISNADEIGGKLGM
jgi:hypothetical protein